MDHIHDTPGLPVGTLAAKFDVSRIAVINHLAVLKKANLILLKRSGKARHLYLNAAPTEEIQERWTDAYSAQRAERTSLIKQVAEVAHQRTQDG